jgi:hypothetical protein
MHLSAMCIATWVQLIVQTTPPPPTPVEISPTECGRTLCTPSLRSQKLLTVMTQVIRVETSWVQCTHGCTCIACIDRPIPTPRQAAMHCLHHRAPARPHKACMCIVQPPPCLQYKHCTPSGVDALHPHRLHLSTGLYMWRVVNGMEDAVHV